MADWQSLPLGALGQLFDGPHATPTRREEGPYFLNISSLKSGRLDLAESDHVSREDFGKWTKRVTPRKDDLLFSYETRLGEAALMPEGIEACLGRRMALLRPDTRVIDPRFLLYYYLSPAFQDIIAKHTIHGATVTRIGLATMPRWEVALPPLREQRAIGEVLGVLDDKIAANVRASRLLDDFSAALVTEAAADGEKSRLGDVLRLAYGKALPAPSRVDGTVDVYGSGGVVGKHDQALVNGPGIVVGRKGTVGAVYWSPGPHFAIDTTFYVEPIADVPAEVLYFLLRRLRLAELNSDSAVPGLNRDQAYAQSLRAPRGESAVPLSNALRAHLEMSAALHAENARLARLRDELLPPLMLGTVRVRDAEKSVEGVA